MTVNMWIAEKLPQLWLVSATVSAINYRRRRAISVINSLRQLHWTDNTCGVTKQPKTRSPEFGGKATAYYVFEQTLTAL